jgi:tRNA pseudouridine55 synthase
LSLSRERDGVLLINKPVEWTSHDLVAKVRGVFGIKQVGHCGTLDPIATGLMLLTVGRATKISQHLGDRDKTYVVKMKFGVTTDTLDRAGKIISEKPVTQSREQIAQEALTIQGDICLEVPKFSAVKISGQKLYEYARSNKEIELPIRLMKFYDLEILDQGDDWLIVKMSCSKGTYVRSWVHFLGQKLGCGAHVIELERTASQPYFLKDAVSLEELQSKDWDGRGFISMSSAFVDYKTVYVSGQDLGFIRNGQISKNLRAHMISVFKPGLDHGVKVLSQNSGELMALVGLESGKGFVIQRVFHY